MTSGTPLVLEAHRVWETGGASAIQKNGDTS